MLHHVLEQHAAAARTGPGTGPAPASVPAAISGSERFEPDGDTESLPPVTAAPAPVVMIPPEPAAARVTRAARPPGKPAAPVPGRPPVRCRGPRRARGLWAVLISVLGIAAITAAISLAVSRTSDHPMAHQPSNASARSSVRVSAPASAPSTPSSPAPAATGGGASAYYRITDSTGFSIGVPVGWQLQHAGHYVYIRDPANGGIFLLIDQSDQPKPDPLADWQQQAAARQGSYPGYHLTPRAVSSAATVRAVATERPLASCRAVSSASGESASSRFPA
jgi:eukaryotic-like serine/threonine-protein kinase